MEFQSKVCICGKVFTNEQYPKNFGKMKYCSATCSQEKFHNLPWRRVKDVIKVERDGYTLLSIDNFLMPEHIFVWESYHGRIPKGFMVHHMNQDKSDNRIENLEILDRKTHGERHKSKFKTNSQKYHSKAKKI